MKHDSNLKKSNPLFETLSKSLSYQTVCGCVFPEVFYEIIFNDAELVVLEFLELQLSSVTASGCITMSFFVCIGRILFNRMWITKSALNFNLAGVGYESFTQIQILVNYSLDANL